MPLQSAAMLTDDFVKTAILNRQALETKNLFYYMYTVTFIPQLLLGTKYKYINNIYGNLRTECQIQNVNGIIIQSVEYHKQKYGAFIGNDDVCKPHVHGMLVTDYPLSQKFIIEYHRKLNKSYGRSEFVPMEKWEDIERWYAYINKDCEKLNNQYPTYSHSKVIPFDRSLHSHLPYIGLTDLEFWALDDPEEKDHDLEF